LQRSTIGGGGGGCGMWILAATSSKVLGRWVVVAVVQMLAVGLPGTGGCGRMGARVSCETQ